MREQEKILPFEPGPGQISGARLPPPGSVPRGALEPVRVDLDDPAVIAFGGERFAIFCAPCHGAEGAAEDIVPTIPRPPSFYIERLRQQPPDYFVRVMTEGIGAMYPVAGRVPEAHRWAIAAWIKAQQDGE